MLATLLPLLIAGAPAAADASVVTSWGAIAEPSYPTTLCATLPATLTARDGSIDAADADGASPTPISRVSSTRSTPAAAR